MSKILVIDDEPGMQQIIQRIISPLGYEIFFADDGNSALNSCEKTKPDLIIMDITLPDMECFEIMASLKKMHPGLVFVILTSISEVQTAVELVKNGAYDYISKPFKIDDFVQLVKRAMPVEVKKTTEESTEQTREVPFKVKTGQRKSRFGIVLGVIISLIVFFGALFGKLCYENSLNSKFMIPYPNPSAIVAAGKDIWIADWATESVYKYEKNSSLMLLKKYKLKNIQPSGMSCDGKNLWVSNSFEGKIYKLNMDSELSTQSTYDSPGPSPSGLFIDKNNLWSIDFQQAKIYKHLLDDKLTVEGVYDSPGKNPCAIFGYKNHFFIADGQTNRIYEVSKEEFMLEAAYTLPDFEENKLRLSSITFDGKSIWACSDGSQKVFRCSLKSLRPVKL